MIKKDDIRYLIMGAMIVALAALKFFWPPGGYIAKMDIDATCLEHKLVITDRYVHSCIALQPIDPEAK